MRGLKYISWYERSGYGIAAERYLHGLLRAGVPLTWAPMVPGPGWGREFHYAPWTGRTIGDAVLDPVCNKTIDYDTVLIHLVPEYYARWCELEAGKRIIGYATWETDRLPRAWPGILNRLDRVWVPSRWNKEVFRRSGVCVPIDVVPHVLEPMPPAQTPASRTLTEGIPPESLVFYTINVWSARKALWLVCEAFRTAFSDREPVVLVVKTSAYDSTSRWARNRWPLRELARTKRSFRKWLGTREASPPIRLVAEENVPQAEIEALHRRGDCYVSLSRSEGWGLGAFDAVAAGNPVIMTGYGGQTDFLRPDAAGLVDYRMVPVSDPLNPESYSPDQNWAEPNPGHAGQLMREVFENREEARARGARLLTYAQQKFNERVIIDDMLSILDPSR